MEGIDAVGGVTISLSQAESDYINYPQGTYAEDHIREMGIANQVQRVTPVSYTHLGLGWISPPILWGRI